jgi:hypothetical protein
MFTSGYETKTASERFANDGRLTATCLLWIGFADLPFGRTDNGPVKGTQLITDLKWSRNELRPLFGPANLPFDIRHWSFVVLSSFVLRHSSFVHHFFRPLLSGGHPLRAHFEPQKAQADGIPVIDPVGLGTEDVKLAYRCDRFSNQGSDQAKLILGEDFQTRRWAVSGYRSVALVVLMRMRHPALHQGECPSFKGTRRMYLCAYCVCVTFRNHLLESFTQGGDFLFHQRNDRAPIDILDVCSHAFPPPVRSVSVW